MGNTVPSVPFGTEHCWGEDSSIHRSPDARATALLKQRLDVAIQRGNVAAVVETLKEGIALQDQELKLYWILNFEVYAMIVTQLT